MRLYIAADLRHMEHIVEAVRGLGLEGVVAKREDSLLRARRAERRLEKLKLENQQEFVIGGTAPDRTASTLYSSATTMRSACSSRAR